MRLDDLRQTKNTRPFEPFVISLADGQEIPVSHPDSLAWEGEHARTIYHVATDGTRRWFDVMLVTSIRMAAAREGDDRTNPNGST